MIRVKNNKKNSCLINMDNFKFRKSGIVVLAAMLMSGVATTAHAGNITNEATATGIYNNGTINSDTLNPATVDVPVATPSRSIEIALLGTPVITSTGGGIPEFPDAGDTITYQYKITNKGNLTEDVDLTAPKPSFKPIGSSSYALGTTTAEPVITLVSGTPGALLPEGIATYNVVYTLSDNDALASAGVVDGISLVATAKAENIDGIADVTDVNATAVESTIAAVTQLSITKAAYSGTTISSGTIIDSNTTDKVEGDIVTYAYIITNDGNVPIKNVKVADVHEGVLVPITSMANEAIYSGKTGFLANTTYLGDASETSDTDGIVEELAAGAEVIFKYEHAITQAEVLAQ